MLSVILKKRVAQAFAGILVMLLLVIVTIAFADNKGEGYIIAKDGGTIVIDDDTCLVISKNALEHDTFITAKVVYSPGKTLFYFEPEGLVFNKRVYLQKSKASMKDAGGRTLYYAPDESNPDNYTEEIKPKMGGDSVKWFLEHFSLYYHRRR